MPINLAPWREKNISKSKKIILLQFIMEFVIFVIAFEIFEIKNDRLLSSKKNLYHQVQIEFENIHKEYLSWKSIQETEPLIYKKYEFFKKNTEDNQAFFEILDEINKNIQRNTYLTRIEKKENNIFITGNSPSHLELSVLLKHIGNSKQKNHINLKTSKSENNDNEVNFSIELNKK